MRIDNTQAIFNFDTLQTAARRYSAPAEGQSINYFAPGVVVEISQQAKDAYNNSVKAADEAKGIEAAQGLEGCQTCKNRRYVDQSSDSSVSYQSPTHISPEQSAGKVMAHEREHISNDQSKAEREDRRVVSQTVSLSTSICPECGKVYVSGGIARTVTAGKNKDEAQIENNNQEKAAQTI
jgi:ribosomal protein L32